MAKSMTGDVDDRILREQARYSLESVGLTIVSNVVIALSAVLIIYADHRDEFVVYWFCAIIAVSVLRSRLLVWMKSRDMVTRDPKRVLRVLLVTASVSGLSWCPIPLLYVDMSSSRAGALIVFITAGITAGAIIQSVASWRIALAFGVPVMFATILRMLLSGDGSGYVVAADVLFFTAMMFRAAFLAERRFIGSQLVAWDATELAKSLERANGALETRARTDPLTGLANRVLFREIAAESSRRGQPMSVILLDVDEFKTINDTWGHRTGDLVLGIVADRVRSECRAGDLAVRFGGDEFVVLMRGDDLERRTRALAEVLFRRLQEPVEFDDRPLSFSCSLGVALAVDGIADVDGLLVEADLALYRSKTEGRARISFFDAAMEADLAHQKRLDADLPRALEREELDVEFQPQVAMSTREPVGFEALLRWRHPQIGPVSPPDIVRSALRLGLSEPLIRFVAERACRLLHALAGRGLDGIRVAINVSPNEFSLVSPAAILSAVAAAHGVRPDRLEIEITEETLFDPKKHAVKIAEIRRHGLSLAIDDFGSGNSSIAHLAAGEFDTVKIDRSLVHGLLHDRRKTQLVGAITAVARPLGYRIIAEGVETEEDAETLRMLGCTLGQGWLFGRPMPFDRALDGVAPMPATAAPFRQPPAAVGDLLVADSVAG